MTRTIRLPNALVIGAPKSGTTSLYNYLKQHPDVFLPVQKELHYFSYDFLQKNANGPGDKDALSKACDTIQKYEAFYAAAETENVIAEVSPSYLYYCQVSERIRSELGTVKIIALLRSPVKRAFSQYMHLVHRNRETLSFYNALMAEPQRREAGWSDMWRYAESSRYASRIKKYISVFGRNNVKIVLTDDLAHQPHEVMCDLFEFLEVDPDFHPDLSVIHNRSGVPRSKLLANIIFKPSGLKTLAKKLVPKPILDPIGRALLKANLDKGKLDKKSKAYLMPYFRTDVLELEEIIGRRTDWIK